MSSTVFYALVATILKDKNESISEIIMTWVTIKSFKGWLLTFVFKHCKNVMSVIALKFLFVSQRKT